MSLTAAPAIAGTYTYSWTGPNSFTSNQQNPVINNVTANQAGVYTVTMTDGNVCTSTSSVTSTVNAQPTTPSLTATSLAVCSGTNLVFNTPAVATTYQWIAPNGNITTIASNSLTVTSASADYLSGNWTLKVLDGNGCSSQTSLPIAITINSIPATPVASNGGPVCSGSNVNLYATTEPNGVYAWTSTPAGFTSGVQNPTVTNVVVGTVYSVTVTVNGCTSASASTTPTINTATSVSAGVSATNCIGGSMSLTAAPAIAGTYTYSWTGPNSFTSNQQNPVINNVTANQAGVYTVTMTDGNVCTSTSSVTSTVNAQPTTPSLTATSLAVCSGTNLVFNTPAVATTYQWIAPNGNITTIVSNSLTVTSSSSDYLAGNWTLKVLDGNGCSSQTSLPIAITINSIPSTPVASNGGPVCSGSNVNLYATTEPNGVYAWTSTPAGFTSGVQNPTVTNVVVGTVYSVTVTVNGCTSASASTTPTINTATSVSAGVSVTNCIGGSMSLTAAPAIAGTYTYSWTGPNSFTSNQQNPVINNVTANQAGVYTVTMTDGNVCTSTSSVTATVNAQPTTPSIDSHKFSRL